MWKQSKCCWRQVSRCGAMTQLVLFVLCCVAVAVAHGPAGGHQDHGYKYGAPLEMQCKNENGTWSSDAGISCMGVPHGRRSLVSSFKFGVDTFFQCTWVIAPEQVPLIVRLINREESMHW